jgi:hypothetical protein
MLAGDGVDRRHACFEAVGPGRYALADLGSEHGTFVSGRRIRGPVELKGDEQLCFGDTFAQLLPVPPSARRRRRVLAVAGATAAVVAAAGVTAGILAPRTGGGPADAVNHAAAAPAPADPAAATVTVTEETPAQAPVETETPEPSAEPPPATTEAAAGRRVVVREDFSDPQSGWEVFSVPTVEAGYDQGAYAIRINDPTWYATVDSGLAFDDPTIAVTVQNPGRAGFAGFGLLCNYRGEQRFDVLAVGTDGTFAILEQRGDALTVISEGGAWARSPRVPVGAERYRLRADCRGQALQLWVNGRFVGSARSQEPGGRIGLFAAGLAEFRFDNLVVRSRAESS